MEPPIQPEQKPDALVVVSPVQPHPPSIAEPFKWFVYHLIKDGPAMFRMTPIGSTALLVGSLFVAWAFTWHIAVPELNLQLATKQGQIEQLKDQRDRAESQLRDKTKEINDLKIYRGKDTPPLKKNTLIMVSQIRELIKKWHGPKEAEYQFAEKYRERFGQRVNFIRDDLDQNGEQSDLLDQTLRDWTYYGNEGIAQMTIIADEIEKLANKLPAE
jgi:hypothetical protein